MVEFSYVRQGDRLKIPSAAFHNAVVDALLRINNIQRGIVSSNELSVAQFTAPRKQIYVNAHADIEAYSIFTLDDIEASSGPGGFTTEFDERYPKAYTKQIDSDSPMVWIVNESQELAAEGHYILSILGDERPFLVKYVDAPPSLGQIVGPKPHTYGVSTEYTGLQAVSEPDLENERIFVVRVPPKTGHTIRFTILNMIEECVAEVLITARPCGISQVPEEVNGRVTVYDPCCCFFNEPSVDLVGRCGGAVYMQPADTDTGTGTNSATGTVYACQWEVIWLCCPVCE